MKTGRLNFNLPILFGRDDPTRTDDPYVPNVVRYQLRYIPIAHGLCDFSGKKELHFCNPFCFALGELVDVNSDTTLKV